MTIRLRNPHFILAAVVLLLCLSQCEPTRQATQRPDRHWVVLVPGLWDDASRFDHLRPVLQRQGWRTLDFPLNPNNGSASNGELAMQLGRMIEKTVPPGDRVSIIGFSMGGLVARSYVQDFGGLHRVAQLLMIGTPNQGTETARLLLMPGVREMVPGSAWLQRLNHGSFGQLRQIRYGVIWSTTDGVVFPSASSQIPGAWERQLSGVFHAALSSDPRVHQAAVEFLRSPR